MAVIPSLAVMAGLTLLFNPEAQPEGTEIDYTPMRPFAVRLQRAWRRFAKRGLTPVRRIQRVWKGFSVRGNLPLRWIPSVVPGYTTYVPALRNTRRAVELRRLDYLNYQRTRGPLGLVMLWARERAARLNN